MRRTSWLWIAVAAACVALGVMALQRSAGRELPDGETRRRPASRGEAEAPPVRLSNVAQDRESWGVARDPAAGAAQTGRPEAGEAADSAPAPGPGARARGARGADEPSPELNPAQEAELEEELRITEDALEASRQLAEEAVGGSEARAPASPPQVSASGAARPRRVGCSGTGGSCLSSAGCCAGLTCAGAVPGFGTRGRCEAPR
jgi:hypothetical protein